MTTDYNRSGVARQYQLAKEQPWRSRIEAYSFLKRIGDLSGKSVVDMACGEGHFTRQLRQRGASRVVGFDLSERMVELARVQEQEHPLGIEYLVHDARETSSEPAFDLAVSAWLLVYAHDREELARMCQGMASWLRPGGRFITFTMNPAVMTFQPPGDYRRYGFEVLTSECQDAGAPVLWRLHLDDSTLDIENYYLPVSMYEAELHAAGFREVQMHPVELEPPSGELDDRDHWAEFLRAPPAIIIEGTKAHV